MNPRAYQWNGKALLSTSASVDNRGFIKGWPPGNLTSCEDNLACWFGHLHGSRTFFRIKTFIANRFPTCENHLPSCWEHFTFSETPRTIGLSEFNTLRFGVQLLQMFHCDFQYLKRESPSTFKLIIMRLFFSGAKLKVHSLVNIFNIVLQCSQRGIVWSSHRPSDIIRKENQVRLCSASITSGRWFLPCSEGFSPGSPVFLPLQIPTPPG